MEENKGLKIDLIKLLNEKKLDICTYQNLISILKIILTKNIDLTLINNTIYTFFNKNKDNQQYLLEFLDFCNANLKVWESIYFFIVKNLIYIDPCKNDKLISKIFNDVFCLLFERKIKIEETEFITREIYDRFVEKGLLPILVYHYIFFKEKYDEEVQENVLKNLDLFIEFNSDVIYQRLMDLNDDLRVSLFENFFKISTNRNKILNKFKQYFKAICSEFRTNKIIKYNEFDETIKIGILCPFIKNDFESDIILNTISYIKQNSAKKYKFTIFIYKSSLIKKSYSLPKELENNIYILPLSFSISKDLIFSMEFDYMIYTGVLQENITFFFTMFDLAKKSIYMWDDFYNFNLMRIENIFYPEIFNVEYFARFNQISVVNYQSIFHLPNNFQYIGLPFEIDMLTEPFIDFLLEIINKTTGFVLLFPFTNDYDKNLCLNEWQRKYGENFILKIRFCKIEEFSMMEIAKFVSGCSLILDPILFNNRMPYFVSLMMNKIIITLENSFSSVYFKKMQIFNFIKDDENSLIEEINKLNNNDRVRWEKLINIKKYVLFDNTYIIKDFENRLE
jgi:hypothetical protein